jgi:hypothetical protein
MQQVEMRLGHEVVNAAIHSEIDMLPAELVGDRCRVRDETDLSNGPSPCRGKSDV